MHDRGPPHHAPVHHHPNTGIENLSHKPRLSAGVTPSPPPRSHQHHHTQILPVAVGGRYQCPAHVRFARANTVFPSREWCACGLEMSIGSAVRWRSKLACTDGGFRGEKNLPDIRVQHWNTYCYSHPRVQELSARRMAPHWAASATAACDIFAGACRGQVGVSIENKLRPRELTHQVIFPQNRPHS